MGKGIITYQKRLELIDECLRKYERPMTIKEIHKYCNQRLNTDTSERMYRKYLEQIESDYGLKINREQKRDGCQCFVYQNIGSSIIKGNSAANQVVLCNLIGCPVLCSSF